MQSTKISLIFVKYKNALSNNNYKFQKEYLNTIDLILLKIDNHIKRRIYKINLINVNKFKIIN